MGPIVNKIDQYLKTEGLSEETVLVLENLKKETQMLEKQLVNSSYDTGYTDKERGKRPTWDQYSAKYSNYFKVNTFGNLS